MPCRALGFLGFPWSGQEGEPSCPRREPSALQPTEVDQRGHLLVTWCRVLKGCCASPRLRPPPAAASSLRPSGFPWERCICLRAFEVCVPGDREARAGVNDAAAHFRP